MKTIKSLGAVAIVFSLLFTSCNNAIKEKETTEKVADTKEVNDLAKGFQLLETSCFSCHSPGPLKGKAVAPTMLEIKNAYISENTTEEEYVQALTMYLNNPVAENSKLPVAIEMFGVMPNIGFSDEQIKEVATYIYNTELENPNWYATHYKEEKKKYMKDVNTEDLSYAEIGLNLALSTKSVLGKNLMGQVKANGPAGAVSFCNTEAYPILDSMSLFLNASIKRVSDKPRNPASAANEMELAYINSSKETLADGIKIKPEVKELNGKMVGYYPILTNDMCMKCHGNSSEEINIETLERINTLYPEDLATGYAPNELRGIWVVEMDKKEKEL